EIKACALNFALKANLRLASNLKSFIIKISRCVPLDAVSGAKHDTIFQKRCLIKAAGNYMMETRSEPQSKLQMLY
ncbi:hypothetical protein DSO57_1039281, partial [Entomophthora muscae]